VHFCSVVVLVSPCGQAPLRLLIWWAFVRVCRGGALCQQGATVVLWRGGLASGERPRRGVSTASAIWAEIVALRDLETRSQSSKSSRFPPVGPGRPYRRRPCWSSFRSCRPLCWRGVELQDAEPGLTFGGFLLDLLRARSYRWFLRGMHRGSFRNSWGARSYMLREVQNAQTSKCDLHHVHAWRFSCVEASAVTVSAGGL
jgi:hypothetical protein